MLLLCIMPLSTNHTLGLVVQEDVMICLFSVHQLNSFRHDVISVIFSALPLLEAHKVISNVDTQKSITIIIIIVINTNQKTNMYC